MEEVIIPEENGEIINDEVQELISNNINLNNLLMEIDDNSNYSDLLNEVQRAEDEIQKQAYLERLEQLETRF